jgi:anti-sigma factor RsiW
MTTDRDELSCRELVELVTDYVEGALPSDDVRRFEEHLAICEGCVNYVDQLRGTIAVVGSLSEESIDPVARGRLLESFRGWKQGRRAAPPRRGR